MEKIKFETMDKSMEKIMTMIREYSKGDDSNGGILKKYISSQKGIVSYLNGVSAANKFDDNLKEILFIAFLSYLWALKGEDYEDIPSIEEDDLLKNEKGIIEDMQKFFSNSENMTDEEKIKVLIGSSFQDEALLFFLSLFMDKEFEDKFTRNNIGDPGAVCFFAMRNIIEVLDMKTNM